MEYNIEIIETSKGKKCVLRDGYKYLYHRKNKTRTQNFRCSMREICNASITIDADFKKNIRDVGKNKHTCHRNFVINDVERAMETFKKKSNRIFRPYSTYLRRVDGNSYRRLSGFFNPQLLVNNTGCLCSSA
jgi:hypothetical protein